MRDADLALGLPAMARKLVLIFLPLLLRILCTPTEQNRQRMRLVAVSAARRDNEEGSR